MFPLIDIKITEDGSTTLYRSDLDEHYHSIHGAIQESMHIFIEMGLQKHQSNALKILEIGFGTGLNALLTMLNAENRQIAYHTVEKMRLEDAIIEQINYPKLLSSSISENWFKKIHQAEWNREYEIEPWFKIKKIEADITDYQFETDYDIVYYDAFSPEKQPELWNAKIFKQIFCSMSNNSILTTYCSKGTVRRALLEVGFKVERVAGPYGKRHIIVAHKVIN